MPKRLSTRIWSGRKKGARIGPGENSNNNNHTIKMNHYNPLLVIENLEQQLEECKKNLKHKKKLNQENLGGVNESATVISNKYNVPHSLNNNSALRGGAKHRRLTKRRRHTKRNTKKKQIRKYRKVGGDRRRILYLIRKLNERLNKNNYSEFSTMGTNGRVKLIDVINALKQSGETFNKEIRGFDEDLINKILIDKGWYTDMDIRNRIKQSFYFQ